MTTGMPELGSKISLISKADIRYEGRLFTVDPQECTIALASVRSFGTEDRETQYPVPAQNQVYDYILFRGSDIKDIRVVNNVPSHPQPLNDPAIMQLSVPPTLGGQPFQSHPVLGPMGPQLGQFGGYGGLGVGPPLGMRDARLGGKPSELIMGGPTPSAPSVLSPTVEPPRPVNDHELIGGGGSRSTTPASLSSRKSPTADQCVQTGGGVKRDDKRSTVRPIQPPGGRSQQQQHQHQTPQHQQQQRRRSRERRDSRGGGNRAPQQQQGGYQGNHSANRGGGNWSNRGQPLQQLRSRGRPRGGNGGFRNGQTGQTGKTKSTLKFDNDYDFEQANTEFEELRSQLGKMKIEEGNVSNTAPKPDAVNGGGGGDADKKDDSGNETGAGEPEQEEEHEVYYDKSKSFFDKISCEAVERAKGRSQRTDWRTERKLNSETFGVAAARRGVYRGRGGYRGGMGFRGGYRTNYRPPQRREQPQVQQNPQQGNQIERNMTNGDVSAADTATNKSNKKAYISAPDMTGSFDVS